MSDGDEGIVGYYDTYANHAILGWAYNEYSPDDAVAVELLVDGVLVDTVLADLPRLDLAAAGLGNVRHGFRLEIPPSYFDSAPHALELRVAGPGTSLKNVPAMITFGEAKVEDPRPAPTARITSGSPSPRISLIMPTYNRAALMERAIRAYSKCAQWELAEVIVVDDGSRDGTSERLNVLAAEFSNVIATRTENGGPGAARNIAASLATAPVLLFVGDDIEPVEPSFIETHLEAHAALPEQTIAVLGKIVWPERSDISYLMQHIQGEGQQQFGFKFMEPYKYYHWPFFYTSNVSIKRDLVDWKTQGFDTDFDQYGFEDAEFAYRLSKRAIVLGKKFEILYVPAAAARHDHPHTVATFIRRQTSCGMMARTFFCKHPEVVSDLGLHEINDALKTPRSSGDLVELYLPVFEGLKSWIQIIENTGGLGSQNWHSDTLAAIFELCYYEGYLRAITDPEANVAGAARSVFDRVTSRLGQSAFREVLARGFPRP